MKWIVFLFAARFFDSLASGWFQILPVLRIPHGDPVEPGWPVSLPTHGLHAKPHFAPYWSGICEFLFFLRAYYTRFTGIMQNNAWVE